MIGAVLSVILAATMLVSSSRADSATERLVFNTTTPANDLQGALAARVQFAQSQIIPARPREGDHNPI